MGCSVSTVASGASAGGLRVGDHVELRRGAPTFDTLGLGEVGELLEMSVAGAGRVRGPRHRDKWIKVTDLQPCAPPGLAPLQQAVWWLRRAAPQLRDAPSGDIDQFAALGAVDAHGSPDDTSVHEPTHYDLLAPFLPAAALPHVAARSQSLGGAWAGESTGAILVAQVAGMTTLVEDQIAQLGEAGAVRIEQLCDVLYGALVETACGQAAAVPSCIPHIYGDRIMVCFGSHPVAAGAPASTRASALVLRLAVTVVQAADLDQMDTLGKNDPFVEVALGNQAERTTTIDGGGSEATWGIPFADQDQIIVARGPHTSGETFYFEVPDHHPGDTFAVRVFDADLGGQDDLIGETAVPVRAPSKNPVGEPSAASESCYEGWFDINRGGGDRPDQTGSSSGRVYLRVRVTWIDDNDRASVAACHCAQAMQDCVREWGTDAGLSLSCGIGSGSIQWAHLHSEALNYSTTNAPAQVRSVRRKAMVRGTAVMEAHRAARHAGTGHICVAAAVAESAQEGFRFHRCGDDLGDDTLRLLQISRSSINRDDEDSFTGRSLDLPDPSDVGCSVIRAKAHREIVPYVPRLAVSFAQAPAEFRRVCVLGVQLHGFSASDVSMRQLADLNAAFQDACRALEAAESDGIISQMGYAMSPTTGPNDNHHGSCSALCLFGLGNSEDVAVRCEENAVRSGVRLVELLRAKTCGGQLPVQAQQLSSMNSVNCVGASCGVASGWAWVGRVGHARARHELCAFGQCVSDALTLMADPAASGTVLCTSVVEAKVADEFEMTAVPPFALSAETRAAMEDDTTVFRACRPKEYL